MKQQSPPQPVSYETLKQVSGNDFLQYQINSEPGTTPVRIETREKKKPPLRKQEHKQNAPDNHQKYIQSVLSARDEALKVKRKTERELGEELGLLSYPKQNQYVSSKE